jgi:glycosyltransferase involved in cell wall biosynthesis
MLFFGLVRAYKGLDLLLDAFAQIKDTLPDLQLIIAGEFYEDEEKYRAQIAANGLTERVTVRNEFVPDSDLRKYFGAADLIVQPYKSATQSGVTQVAFHFEKPMLVTNVGGLGEIVHDHKMGYACEPTAEAIAADVADYFEHDRRKAFTAYLQKEKTKYAWSKMTQAFLELRMKN